MTYLQIVTSVLIALGAGVMFLCVLGTKQVLSMLKGDKYFQGWRILFFLMIFFLVGYLGVLVIVLAGIQSFLPTLTGIIFFFGALFVYLAVQIGRLTIDDLLKTTVSRNYLDKAHAELEQGIQQRTAELSDSNARLRKEIAERRQAEVALRCANEEIRQLNAELEQRVVERTAQLEALNQELETFAYSVSHDLRAPLRAMHGYASFLFEDLGSTLEGEQKRYLDGLVHAVDEAEALIGDLLALSRIGRQNIRLEALEVGVFLQELIAALNLPPDVEIEWADAWPVLDTEPTLLRQIFQNLILNAIKFNHSSPKRIQMGWQLDGPESYELFVRDNGIGIDPLHHEKIFGLFQRLHSSREFEGTGVGLALVNKAVSKLGGSIKVDSISGEGSTFIVTLPKIQGEA
jgi:signal transduction histidine kinase